MVFVQHAGRIRTGHGPVSNRLKPLTTLSWTVRPSGIHYVIRNEDSSYV